MKLLLLLAVSLSFTEPFLAPTPHSHTSQRQAVSTEEAQELVAPIPEEFDEGLTKAILKMLPVLPDQMKDPFVHFLTEYFTASSANPNMTPSKASHNFLEVVRMMLKYSMGPDRFTFKPRHEALQGQDGYNFYKMGCDFMLAGMNKEKSVLLGGDNLDRAFQQIKNGENVIFLANHQTEADPHVLSFFLTEKTNYVQQALDMIYIAGHKVTTDTWAIPFSMGLNLICINSKKHLDVEPELKPKKMEQNLQAMAALTKSMKEGGSCIWVAPSGGRDRRDVSTGEIPITPFDRKTVDMFRLLGNKSKVPTHFYSMSMVSYKMLPPSDSIEASVGEERNFRYVPVGLAISEEIPNMGGAEGRQLFTDYAQQRCAKNYNLLLELLE